MVIVLAVGGGYALAASKVKTITVCADKQTGVLHLKTHGKCKRGQTRVTWNQRGPQGPQGVAGAQGPAGQPGAPAVSVWANVDQRRLGVLRPGALRAARLCRHVPGDDHCSGLCAHGSNAPVITVSDTNPPGGQVPQGAFPVAWYEATGGNQQFMVFTGVVVSGSFTPTDHTFTVMDACM